MAIRSFQDKATAAVFVGIKPKKFSVELVEQGRAKLLILDAAANLEDLRSPPGNHLESLSGDRAGQYSIRINRQWRVCFRFVEGNAFDVEIVDYH